jgi:hypothetical protein
MTDRRIDRVTIAGSREATTVTIPWESRQALFARLRPTGRDDGIAADPERALEVILDDEIVRAFEAAGTSAPVRLTKLAKRRLLEVCAAWLDEVSIPRLPEGIFELRNALEDEKAYGELD